MSFVTKLTLGFLTFSNIVNKELLLVENTPHGHKLCQVYLKAQYSARYSFSLILKGHCIEFKYYADGIHSGLTPPG